MKGNIQWDLHSVQPEVGDSALKVCTQILTHSNMQDRSNNLKEPGSDTPADLESFLERQGEIRVTLDVGLSPGLGRSPGEEKSYPFQYSSLETPMDCIVHRLQRVGHT